MISGKNVYEVVLPLAPLCVAMILANRTVSPRILHVDVIMSRTKSNAYLNSSSEVEVSKSRLALASSRSPRWTHHLCQRPFWRGGFNGGHRPQSRSPVTTYVAVDPNCAVVAVDQVSNHDPSSFRSRIYLLHFFFQIRAIRASPEATTVPIESPTITKVVGYPDRGLWPTIPI
ncbi:hypothetical protein CRG98_024078 [Punica granatum]|uniref:Uncharacterized protein n=1 Tax=Punica granatum TaxID=22663 RepID=A0A2I0JIM7_PUNGR|nr:hypothetical protein CRG98_024078 [Punica granatum]